MLSDKKEKIVSCFLRIISALLRGMETEINWGAVVEDWQVLGEGVVKNIVCKNDKLLC